MKKEKFQLQQIVKGNDLSQDLLAMITGGFAQGSTEDGCIIFTCQDLTTCAHCPKDTACSENLLCPSKK